MRTAIVTTSYPSHHGDPSGHFVRTEALACVAGGDEVHVVAPAGLGGELAEDAGIRAWPIAHGGAFGWPGASSRIASRPWRLAGAARFAKGASDRIRWLRPERIVAHWLVPCAHPIASRASSSLEISSLEIEAVAHGADVRLLLAMPLPLRVHIMGRVLQSAQTVRFVARTAYDQLSAALPCHLRQALAGRAVVQPAAIDIPDVTASAQRIRRACGTGSLAVTVSRLVASKRLDLAIGAAQQLERAVTLCVIGHGPELGRLRRIAGAAPVRFEGQVPREEALGWIAAADVLVHTSNAEAAPTVVREARLLGTPVVACAAGDIATWARTDHGIDVVEPNPAAIARAIERVTRFAS